MDDSGKIYIKDLTTKTRKGYLCVRVMRKWSYNGNVPDGPILYIGLVLTDEEANSIYAQIPESDVERLGSALLLHGVYTIRKFAVRVCRANYVPFDADFMIQMTSYTTITPSKVAESKFPNIVYNITDLNNIRTAGSASAKYIDVLGVVTSEGLPRSIYVKGTDRISSLKEITVQDLSGTEVTATLWDQHVQSFQLKDPSTNEPLGSAVVLFCGCLPKKMFNKTQINIGNASTWYINPDIKEAQPLYARLNEQPVPIHRANVSEQDTHAAAQPKILQHKTVSEMNALDPYDFPDEGFRCTVTITEIPSEQNWWYMGCELCKKRLWNQGGNYFCSPCKWSTATPLYKFEFVAADSTGPARFFCYDVVARQIIRRNCDSLLRAVNNAAGLPEQILRVIGRSFTFTVTLTDQSFESPHTRVYLVDSTLFRPQASVPTGAADLSVQNTATTVQSTSANIAATLLSLPPGTSPATGTTQLDPKSSPDVAAPATPVTVGPQAKTTHRKSALPPSTAEPPQTLHSAGTPAAAQNVGSPEINTEKPNYSRGSSSQARKKLKYDNSSVEGSKSAGANDAGAAVSDTEPSTAAHDVEASEKHPNMQ